MRGNDKRVLTAEHLMVVGLILMVIVGSASTLVQ